MSKLNFQHFYFSFQDHLILQKAFQCDHLVLEKHAPNGCAA